MIYYLLRAYTRWGLWLNFRKVYLEHAERLPAETTVILALNHPTAFLEPILLGTHVDVPCWYMLRGDKFVNGAAEWFLRKIHNLPVWRAAHSDRAALRGNVATMAFATDRVVAGEPTVILSEGSWSGRLRLKRLQRGTSRMLFQAWKKARDKPVAIVPVAANFTDPQAFRSSVTLTFGEPIYARDYADAWSGDARETTDAVTAELERRLRRLVYHLDDRERVPLAEALLPLVQHDYPDSGLWPVGRDAPFSARQSELIDALNAMHRVDARALASEVDDYYRALRAREVTDSGVALPGYGSALRAAGLLALGPFAMAAFLAVYAPGYFVARRAEGQRKSEQFFASVRYGLGLGTFAAYALTWTVVFALLIGWPALLAGPLLYGAAHFYLRWRESFTLWRDATRAAALPAGELARLRRLRADVLSAVLSPRVA